MIRMLADAPPLFLWPRPRADGARRLARRAAPARAATQNGAEAAEDAAMRTWLIAAQGGDEAAYTHLLTAIARRAHSEAFARGLGHNADAAVARTLRIVDRARGTYDSRRPFSPWLKAIIAAACTVRAA